MINLSDITLSYKGKIIFDELAWNIKKNRKYALVGPNGTGKTTLLNVISGIVQVEKGEVAIPRKIVVGYLPQDLNYRIKDNTVIEESLEGVNSDSQDLIVETVRHKAEKILMGLGFTVNQFEEPTSSLSGGWKMRIELAKILLLEPNVLLLDEPTNHLDIESIDWIENYLSNYNGTVVLVSHDKYLIDHMVDTIVELDKGRITEFVGNYSNYLEEKERIREVQISTYKNQQKKIEQTERFIERFRYKNTKASQVQSRVKMLEKMERIEAPDSPVKTIDLKFPEALRSGKIVYEISKFSKIYKSGNHDENIVFEDSDHLRIERGDKIAITGKNGQGKSTLAKMIVGIEDFIGEHKLGHNVELSYYAQNQTEALDLDSTMYDELKKVAPNLSETELRSILGSFLFKQEDLEKKIKVLSGGEKSRVALSMMLVSPTNFLVLDEPTNHLDMQSKDILMSALKNYSGTFLIISHDRYFIDQLINKVWYVENRNVQRHLGNYSEFLEKYHNKLTANTGEENISTGPSESFAAKVSIKKIEAEKRNELHRELKQKGIENMQNWKDLTENQLANALSGLENKITQFENNKQKLENELSNPEIFKVKNEVVKKTRELDKLSSDLNAMYERWSEINEYMDSASL